MAVNKFNGWRDVGGVVLLLSMLAAWQYEKLNIFYLIFGLYFSIVGGLILIVYTRKNKALFSGLAAKALGNKFTLVVGWIVYFCITAAYILFIFNL